MRKILLFACMSFLFLLNCNYIFAQDDGGGDGASGTESSSEGGEGGGEGVCPGDDKEYIILNTKVPFLTNGRCIEKVYNEGDSNTNVSNVFPQLMAVMIRITLTILIVGGFLGILIGGFMVASNGAFGTKQTGVKLILGVIAGLILLGASGILLNLINPNFFGAISGG